MKLKLRASRRRDEMRGEVREVATRAARFDRDFVVRMVGRQEVRVSRVRREPGELGIRRGRRVERLSR